MKKTKIDRRQFLKISLLSTTGLFAGPMFLFSRGKVASKIRDIKDLSKFDWGFLVDTTRCIGCGSCVRACKRENQVSDNYYRTWVERYEIDKDHQVYVDSPEGSLNSFPSNRLTTREITKAFFVPKLCNHCISAVCVQVCPVGATFHTPDRVVLIDKTHCIGCGYCVQACPYGARYLDHDIGTADKCTFCYHRIHNGLKNACVEACPRKARLCGNLKDENSFISQELRKRRYSILKPEMYTLPKCYYIGLDQEVK